MQFISVVKSKKCKKALRFVGRELYWKKAQREKNYRYIFTPRLIIISMDDKYMNKEIEYL